MSAEEEAPLMEMDNEKDAEENKENDAKPEEEKPPADGPAPGDYVENGKWCCCMPLKVGVIIIGILLIIDFFIEVFELVDLSYNEYFEPMYFYIYLALILVYAVAVVLYCIYLFGKDSPSTRGLTPWALLIAGIVSILIAVWIIVYIFFIYPENKVYIPVSEKGRKDDKKYSYGTMSKEMYVVNHIIEPAFAALLFLTAFCWVKAWVSRHEK